MSKSKAIVVEDQVATTESNEVKERRKAKSIVHGTLLSSASTLEHRGQKSSLLPAFWYAAMNILIECMEPGDVLAVIMDRARGISANGSAENADAPAKVLSDPEMDVHIERVTAAGRTVVEKLMEAYSALEAEELEDYFPETVLDSAILVLKSAWGPDHLVRALTEQSALLIRGVVEPLNFMEPVRYVEQGKPLPHAQAVSVPLPPCNPAPASRSKRRRSDSSRFQACVYSDLDNDGRTAWAVWISTDDGERFEERLLSGTRTDPTGRHTWVWALKECVDLIASGTASASGRILLGNEEMVRALKNEPGSRLIDESDLWSDMDDICDTHDFEFAFEPLRMSGGPMERCDMRCRELLANA